jgi:glucose-1-phosphate cytidylyltransferase
MKAVILAGGLGTRLSEETQLRPKPMIEIGGLPILWHIMKLYSNHGINDFIICCGYKGYVIKEYFNNYFLHMSDVTFDMMNNKMTVHTQRAEHWNVTLVDTGELTMTGGRLKRVSQYLEGEKAFCLTYGDGLSDVNISKSIEFHFSHGKLATLTSVFPPGRFGHIELEDNNVTSFKEKPKGDGARINGGFFVLSAEVLHLLSGDDCVWEDGPLQTLANSQNLQAFHHDGFWQAMDTLRDKIHLDKLWSEGAAPWKVL